MEHVRGNSNGKIVRHHLVWLAMKLVVAPGLNITVDHRPFSERAEEMTGYTWHLPVKMAGQKHTNTSSSSSCDSSQSEKKDRRQITIRTFKKWQGQYNTPHKSLTW